jgi:hypothetical protein
MFIDGVKNRYTYLNSLKNIVWEEPVERPHNTGMVVVLAPEMEPLLDKLIQKRPTWRFKSTQRVSTVQTRLFVSRFDIYDGDEELGEVWLERHWRSDEPRYFFNNFRLAQGRQRTSYTTKPEVAVKRIMGAFHMKTPTERAIEAMSMVRKVAQDRVNDTTWPLRRAKGVIEAALFDYAVRRWDEVSPLLGSDASKIDLPGLRQAALESQVVYKAVSDGLGANVRLEPNGTYSVSRTVNDNAYRVDSYTDATLPDHICGAIGLLKLMEDGNAIEGVGLRVNANLFFIMDKKEAV